MGGDPRRPHVQHQNKFAFKHNKASRKTAKILALPNEGLCTKCHDIIEWRKQFRKYKPLTTPRRCQICDQKKVTRAYHNICDNCATQTNTCAKCREHKVIVNPIITPEQEKADMDLVRGAMSVMSERERRTFLRTLNANKPEQNNNNGEEEEYWAPEEEIDWVKAARLLRNIEAMKLEKSEAKEKGEEDGEGDDSDSEKKGEKDSKQTNSDPSEKETKKDEDDGEDEGEDEEDQE